MKKARIKNDLILIGVLLALAAFLALGLFLFRGEGDTVTVTVDGKVFATYSLHDDTSVDIRTGENGEQSNLLLIKDGKARVETATCPDGICAAHRPISKEGESIVCLPHRVVITVSAKATDGPDIEA